MSQVIESDVWQSGPFQDGFEVLVDKAIHIHRPSKLRDENEIYGLRPLLWINDGGLCLPLFQIF